MNEALKGLRIVEAAAFIAAPLAGLQLAQMGADVIRIDPIGGGIDIKRWPLTKDGKSLYWAGLNKGKRSIMIDTRRPEGQELATRLITQPGEDAGFFLSNLQARGWLAYDSLKSHRDDLIMVHIVGNRDGSVALDYTVNAAVGFPFITGPADYDGPVNHVMPVWDMAAAHTAVSSVLVAERHRRRSGEGQYVRLALSDVAFATMSHFGYIAEAEINHDERPRLGNHVFGSFARDFATKDGRRVMVTAFTPRHWQALVEATATNSEMDRLAEDKGYDFKKEEDRYAARETIADIFQPWFAARTFADVRAALDEAGACWGPYQTVSQMVSEDPRVSTQSPLFEQVEHPGIGRTLSAGSVADFSALPRTPVAPAPVLGQHTEQILAEDLNLSAGEIGHLHDDGIVASTT